MKANSLRLAKKIVSECPGEKTCTREECDMARAVVEMGEALKKFGKKIHSHSHDCTLDPRCDVCDCGLEDVETLAKLLKRGR